MRLRQSDYHQRRARAPFVIPDLSVDSRGDVAGGEPRSANALEARGRSMEPAAARFNVVSGVQVGREVLRALAWLAALAAVAVALMLWSPIP